MAKFVLSTQLNLQPITAQQARKAVQPLQSALSSLKLGNIKGGTAEIQGYTKATKQATVATQQMAKASTGLAGNLKRLGGVWAVTFNVVTGTINKLQAAVTEAIKFEREMVRIAQVTGKTGKQLGSLQRRITGLSRGLGVASSELVVVARTLSQASLSAKEVDIALTALAKTNLAATFGSITDTTEGAIAVLKTFGQGVGQLESQLGSINAVAGKFAVESDNIIELVRRAGAVAKQTGTSFNQLVGLFTAVRQTTRQSSQIISTALRTVIQRLQRPATVAFLDELNVQTKDANGNLLDAFTILQNVSRVAAALPQGSPLFAQIVESLGGIRQASTITPLLKNFELVNKVVAEADAGINSLGADSVLALGTTEVALNKLNEEFQTLGRTLAGPGGPFKILIDQLTSVVSLLNSASSSFGFLTSQANNLTVGPQGIAGPGLLTTIGSVGLGVGGGAGIAAQVGAGMQARAAEFDASAKGQQLAAFNSRFSKADQKFALGFKGTRAYNDVVQGQALEAERNAAIRGGAGRSIVRGGQRSFLGAGVGAGVAVGVSGLAEAEQSAKSLAELNKAIKEGNVERQVEIKGQIQTQKELNSFQTVVSGLAGFIGGPLAGSFTALGLQFLEQFSWYQNLTKVGRDLIASFTGLVRSSAELQAEQLALAKTESVFNQQNADLKANKTDATQRFQLRNDLLRERQAAIARDPRINLDSSAAKLSAEEQGILDSLNKQQAAIDNDIAEVSRQIGAELQREGKTVNEEEFLKLLLERLGPGAGRQVFRRENAGDTFAQFQQGQAEELNLLTDNLSKSFKNLTEQALKLIDAQKKQFDLTVEARETIAEFGGAAFTAKDRLWLLQTRLDAGVGALGQSRVDLGGFGLRQRLAEVNAARDDNPEAVGKAQAELVNVTREFIKAKKTELDLLREKNKLEQQGLESALAGDYQAFFRSQAAVGATAAGQLGNQNLLNAFGGQAISDAFANTTDKGLKETLATAGLARVGIGGDAGKVLAGTTPEEQAIEAQIRDAAGVLIDAGRYEVQAADKQVEAANKQLEAANIAFGRAGGNLADVQRFASGGSVFRARGSDTVPAMLTPGEFVVRRSAVQRGNNLQMLKAMNSGGTPSVSSGGAVYAASGGQVPSVGSMAIDSAPLDRAANKLNEAITKLAQTTIQVSVAPMTINHNLQGGSFLQSLTKTIKQELLNDMKANFDKASISQNGQLVEAPMKSNLPSMV